MDGGRFGNLCNLYGPTETTVTATSYHFSNQANIEKVPIGKPISNTQVYIMNGNTLCGIGVPGELCIAGAGVSRGYLNNPMLTAEKFVENPYKLGEKIYRTGDLACWLEDGNIEYLGRTDDQVKIRGFRIELGEIEEKIRTLPGIQDAVVVVKENNDEKYLCGYLVCKAEWNVSEIKMKLKSMLPDYMVPTYIMQIDKLPITRNGKLDKKALPCPEFVLAENYVAPRNKIESAIIEMYKEILHIEQVGIDNDFFELGGHSLKATVLVNSIERKFGMRIPLRKVMELKTVRNLAEEIKEVDGYKLYSPIEKQVDRHSFELTSAQKGCTSLIKCKGKILFIIPLKF
ncbi:non-ribosomal peptide synthetase [Bacillus thuringiensis]